MSSDSGERHLDDDANNGMDTTEQDAPITNDDGLQTPSLESNEGSRASSSSSSGSSVAVSCQSVPTEVVVHGQDVKKIRLLFAPVPPHPSRRRSTSSRSRESTMESLRLARLTTIAQATDDVGHEVLPTPLSQEESLERDASCQQPFNCSAPSDAERANDENAIRSQIRNGVEFISTRMEGLIEMNGQLRIGLGNEIRNCQAMRDSMTAFEGRWQIAERENFELRQQLESKEKEAMQYANQAEELWQAKVRLEENFVEFKRDKDSEIGDLKSMLDKRNLEIKELEVALRNRKQSNRDDYKKREETVEMLAKIKMLEETICSLRKDNAEVSALARTLESDVESWRQQHDVDCHALEIQMQRFDALKTDYVQLQEETQRLVKAQGRVLRDRQQAWSASVIDLLEQSKSLASLPSQCPSLPSKSLSCRVNRSSGASSGSKISNHRQFFHIRRASRDSEHSSCSLPPVSGKVRRFFLE